MSVSFKFSSFLISFFIELKIFFIGIFLLMFMVILLVPSKFFEIMETSVNVMFAILTVILAVVIGGMFLIFVIIGFVLEIITNQPVLETIRLAKVNVYDELILVMSLLRTLFYVHIYDPVAIGVSGLVTSVTGGAPYTGGGGGGQDVMGRTN